jgi:predicted enzyme related to lactoylglutathione lyase
MRSPQFQAVAHEEAIRPGLAGSVVYLNADGIFDELLARVPKAVGKVVNVIDLPPGMGRQAIELLRAAWAT